MMWSGKDKDNGLELLEDCRGQACKGKSSLGRRPVFWDPGKQVWLELLSGENCVERARKTGQGWGLGLRKEAGRGFPVAEWSCLTGKSSPFCCRASKHRESIMMNEN